MIGSRVLLPVTPAAFAEIVAEVAARGQPDRLVAHDQLDLSEVVLLRAPDRKLAGVHEPWQPIEDAIHDGRRYLLGRFTGNPSASHEGHVVVDWWRRPEDKAGYIGWGFFNPQQWPPTHFMELQPPPRIR